MDQSSSAGHMNPASLSASVKSVLTDSLQEKTTAGSSGAFRSISAGNNQNYQVADVFGRCFLRVCYWVEVFSSLRRKGEPVPYAFPKRTPASLKTPVAVEIPQLISEQADSGLPVPPKALQA